MFAVQPPPDQQFMGGDPQFGDPQFGYGQMSMGMDMGMGMSQMDPYGYQATIPQQQMQMQTMSMAQTVQGNPYGSVGQQYQQQQMMMQPQSQMYGSQMNPIPPQQQQFSQPIMQMQSQQFQPQPQSQMNGMNGMSIPMSQSVYSYGVPQFPSPLPQSQSQSQSQFAPTPLEVAASGGNAFYSPAASLLPGNVPPQYQATKIIINPFSVSNATTMVVSFDQNGAVGAVGEQVAEYSGPAQKPAMLTMLQDGQPILVQPLELQPATLKIGAPAISPAAVAANKAKKEAEEKAKEFDPMKVTPLQEPGRPAGAPPLAAREIPVRSANGKWLRKWDKKYDLHYYVDMATNTSQWEEPVDWVEPNPDTWLHPQNFSPNGMGVGMGMGPNGVAGMPGAPGMPGQPGPNGQAPNPSAPYSSVNPKGFSSSGSSYSSTASSSSKYGTAVGSSAGSEFGSTRSDVSAKSSRSKSSQPKGRPQPQQNRPQENKVSQNGKLSVPMGKGNYGTANSDAYGTQRTAVGYNPPAPSRRTSFAPQVPQPGIQSLPSFGSSNSNSSYRSRQMPIPTRSSLSAGSMYGSRASQSPPMEPPPSPDPLTLAIQGGVGLRKPQPRAAQRQSLTPRMSVQLRGALGQIRNIMEEEPADPEQGADDWET